MLIVPGDTRPVMDATVTAAKDGKVITYNNCDLFVLPDRLMAGANETLDQPHLHVANNSGSGVLFVTVLLLVIFITNVPLRGLWSLVAICLIALLAVVFQMAGFWEHILHGLSLLDVRINAAG